MTDALEALANQLFARVGSFWDDMDETYGDVSNKYGSAWDWDDPKEGAHFLWRKAGWDPDLQLPRPQLHNPREDDRFRSSVAFDDLETTYWFSSSTAVFFATMDWGSLQSGNLIIMPSLGQTQQHASGLMGAFKLELEDPRPHMTQTWQGMTHRTRHSYVDMGWDLYGSHPIWEEIVRLNHGRGATQDEVPWYYRSDVTKGDEGFADVDEFLLFLLPDDLKSPYMRNIASVLSYSLGWLALTYGLRTLVNEWEGVNEVLATAPLQGFVSLD